MKQALLEKLEVVELWIEFYEQDGLYGSSYSMWQCYMQERDALLAQLAELQ